jgi:hypothetical protein
MIASLDMIKKAVASLPLSAEVKKTITESTQILIEFREHLAEKHSVSPKEAEDMLRSHVQLGFNSLEKKDFGKAIDVIYDYAKAEGFSKTEELKKAVHDLQKSQQSMMK